MSLFKRREPRSFSQNVQESIWPSMGWRRSVDYYYHRIFRAGHSATRITIGLATGASISWSPFIGTHFLQVALLSWVFRLHMLAGFAGTIWGNPWTFPFMYWLSYHVGVHVCGIFGLSDFVDASQVLQLSYFIDDPLAFFRYLFANPLKLLLPLTLGGYICAVLFWPLSFAVLYYPVNAVRNMYRKQRLVRMRRKRRAKETNKYGVGASTGVNMSGSGMSGSGMNDTQKNGMK